MGRIIQKDRSLIIACDVDFDSYRKILEATYDIDDVGAYKIGLQLGLSEGLPRIVETTRKFTDKPLIYDHQKIGYDLKHIAKSFAQTVKSAGIDAVILFPIVKQEIQKAWIEAGLEHNLGVIVGGIMTQEGFLSSSGGYVSDNAVTNIYVNAAKCGVSDFVVPGNEAFVVDSIRRKIEYTGVKPTLYAPGFGAQGGSVSDFRNVAGDNWHLIVGRDIYQAKDIKQATLGYVTRLYHRF